MSELFANRRDMLHKRVRSFTPGVTIDAHTPEALIEEFFAPGRPDALQKLQETPGARHYLMYHKATLDGLMKRVELFTRTRDPKKLALHKVMEHFEGHDERLTYRSCACVHACEWMCGAHVCMYVCMYVYMQVDHLRSAGGGCGACPYIVSY